jgi:heme/copper-type cytochrome/quinol oxidase subunit 4
MRVGLVCEPDSIASGSWQLYILTFDVVVVVVVVVVVLLLLQERRLMKNKS